MQKCASELKLSRYFLIWQSLLLFASIAIIGYLSWPLLYKLLLILVAFAYSAWTIHQQMQWQEIGHSEEGWYLQRRGQPRMPLELAGDTTMTPIVLVFRFATPGQRFKQTYALFSDALQKDIYRQLVVRIRNCGTDTAIPHLRAG